MGVATIGARSYIMNVVRNGLELAERGHSFSMLISKLESDLVGADAISFPGLDVNVFAGHLDIGIEAWVMYPGPTKVHQ